MATAVPLPVPEASEDGLSQAERRAGWLEILGRDGTLAMTCAQEALKWDGGEDFPYSNPEEIDDASAAGAEWASRLESGARTAAFRIILDPGEDAVTYTDRVVRTTCSGWTDDEQTRLLATIPQRLPATSSLVSLILDGPVWVRTADGTLDPAPKNPYYGLNWGYSGSDPVKGVVVIQLAFLGVEQPLIPPVRMVPIPCLATIRASCTFNSGRRSCTSTNGPTDSIALKPRRPEITLAEDHVLPERFRHLFQLGDGWWACRAIWSRAWL